MQEEVKCVSTQQQVFGYEFWMNEPKSVKERRNAFLIKMGLTEATSVAIDDDSSSSSSSSSCSSSTSDCVEDNVVFCGREYNRNNNNNGNNIDVNDDEMLIFKSCKFINKKVRHWWKEMMKKQQIKCKVVDIKHDVKTKEFKMSRTKVQVYKKKYKELSNVFAAQEIEAHNGIIWTMKFSPDSKYLATAGEDGVVRVWRVLSVDSSLEKFPDESSSKKLQVADIIPDKMFKIEELPVQEFHGHVADVLDLSWSNSANFLLSSSMDKTVRLWQLGSDTCLNTFHHTDYVTCVQFNPVDNRYFISGSIDGKVRKWGVLKQRVLDWADIKHSVTALCYQPDGQAFVVGSVSGSCSFYETIGNLFELRAHILIQSSKRSSTNTITGIQFSSEDCQKVIVSSEDSKIHVLDKMDAVSKYRGLPKSGSQMSASFTSNGRHIISIGQDSHVYLWNHESPFQSSSTQTKSIRSCEHFYSEGVSVAVAVPWCSTETLQKVPSTNYESASIVQDIPNNVSVSNMFSSKSSAIWPEDMLIPINFANFPTWGLVIVTANSDGMIRTFHNYGLPTRI